jgi:hypothetical protein
VTKAIRKGAIVETIFYKIRRLVVIMFFGALPTTWHLSQDFRAAA